MSIYLQNKSFTASAILFVCASALAETPEALIKQALQRNPELNFFIAEIAAARGAVRTAGTLRNPELNTELGYKNSRENSGGANGDGAVLALSFSQTLEYPGRIALRKAIANHDLALADLHLQQFRLTLAARVRSLAYAMTGAHERTQAVQELASRTQSLNDVLKQRPLAGIAPQLEAQMVSANLLTFQRQEREAALAEKTIAAELNQLCGRSADAALTVSAGSIVFTAVSVANLLDAARSNAFDIRIRQVELVQQGFKVALSKNERFPALAVGPFYSLENAIDREQRVGLGVSVPLPLWDRNLGNIASSQARQQQAEASLAMTAREVERRVAQATATLQTKRSEIEAWTTGMLGKLREATELADRNYRLGAVPLTTYVEIQKQYLEAISAFNDAQKEALEAAQTLEILTGRKLYREEQAR
ncbi:MAG TPA: TolC family protein [Candidatus Udaeobacter sp.]|nr:TolC family protein [Candidatus Udaeobacter sp.]